MKKFFFLVLVTTLCALMVSEILAAKPQASGYQLRIAAYQDLKKAMEQVETLKKGGAEAYVEKVPIKHKGMWYRISIGHYAGRAEAEAAGRQFKDGGVIEHYVLQRTAGGIAVPGDSSATEAAPDKKEEKMPAADKKAIARQDNKPLAPPPPVTPGKQTTAPQPLPAQPQPALAGVPKGASFESAVQTYKAGQYQDALAKFSDIDQGKLDPADKEKVLRYIADCHYVIGSKGSNRDLLSAVDGYKELLQKYPDSREENVEALYKLARSYVQLKFFYEARREFLKLYTQYPGSPHQAEALFSAADMSYRTRNFNDAILRYREYLAQYPQGPYIQKAYLGIGDAFSQLQQADQADSWYGEARKRWSMEAMGQESILNMGYHYFRNKKYADAVPVLFFYANMYPDGDETRDVLFSIARSFVEIEQYSAAIKLFSHLIERYPDSREAQESAVIMANVGVKKPGLKFPDIPGIQNYREPLRVYNAMLVQSGMGEMTEGLLFQKGYALWKFGRYGEAFESFTAMLTLFPQGRYKEEGIKNLILNINRLVEQYAAQGDFLAIARIYFKTPTDILNRNADTHATLQIGEALYRVGLLFDAKRLLETLLKTMPTGGADTERLLFTLADIENKRGRYDEAERMLQTIPLKGRTDRKLTTAMHVLKGDICLRKGLYAKAVSSYAEALSAGENLDNPAVVYRNYASALQATNAYDAAIANYDKAVNLYLAADKGPPFYPEEILVTSYQGTGECYLRQGKLQEASIVYKKSILGPPDRRQNLWALYDMGKGYVRGNKQAQAEQVFTDLKNKGGEEFWGNIIDYTVKEKAWTERYAKYLR